MDDTLVIAGKQYISARRAAEISKYAKDYIGQMCRSGKLEGKLIGRNWYIDPHALMALSNKGRSKASDESTSAEVGQVSERASVLLEETTFAYEPKEYSFESDDRPLVPEFAKREREVEAPTVPMNHLVPIEELGVSLVGGQSEGETEPAEAFGDPVVEEDRSHGTSAVWEPVTSVAGHTDQESHYREEIVARKRTSPSKYAVDLRQFASKQATPVHVQPEIARPVRKAAPKRIAAPVEKQPTRHKRSMTVPMLITATVFAGMVLVISGAGNRAVQYPENRSIYEVSYASIRAAALDSMNQINLVKKRNP